MVIILTQGLFQPIDVDLPAEVPFHFDGAAMHGRAGDTLLAALLLNGVRTGQSEFDGTPRAGFCLMGSCQECSVWDAAGRRLRACMTELHPGLRLQSRPSGGPSDG